jgi:hypothetical protein
MSGPVNTSLVSLNSILGAASILLAIGPRTNSYRGGSNEWIQLAIASDSSQIIMICRGLTSFCFTSSQIRYPIVYELYEEHAVPYFRGETTQAGTITISNTHPNADGVTVTIYDISSNPAIPVRLSRSWSSWVIANHCWGDRSIKYDCRDIVDRLARSMRRFCDGVFGILIGFTITVALTWLTFSGPITTKWCLLTVELLRCFAQLCQWHSVFTYTNYYCGIDLPWVVSIDDNDDRAACSSANGPQLSRRILSSVELERLKKNMRSLHFGVVIYWLGRLILKIFFGGLGATRIIPDGRQHTGAPMHTVRLTRLGQSVNVVIPRQVLKRLGVGLMGRPRYRAILVIPAVIMHILGVYVFCLQVIGKLDISLIVGRSAISLLSFLICYLGDGIYPYVEPIGP